MSNIGFKGVDVRQAGNELVFRALLQTSAGLLVTSGTTTLRIYEIQSDGTIKTYDFTSNTFTSGAVTTPTASMNYQLSTNATVDTGIWTYSLATLTGFTTGSIYLLHINNSLAFPPDQIREFQYSAEQGDRVVVGTVAGPLRSSGQFQVTPSTNPDISSTVGAYNGAKIIFSPTSSMPGARSIISTWNSGGVGGNMICTLAFLLPATPLAGDTFTISDMTPTPAQIATTIWTDLTTSSDFATTNSIGKLLVTNIDTNIGSRLASASYTTPPTTAQIAAAILTTPAHLLSTDVSGNVVLAANGFSNIIPEPNAGLSIDARQVLGLIFDAACFGIIAGLPTSPGTISSPDNTKQRASVAFDSADNRTGVTFINLP